MATALTRTLFSLRLQTTKEDGEKGSQERRTEGGVEWRREDEMNVAKQLRRRMNGEMRKE